jgi:ribosomal protein S18 acetylase RimI-like enzyme
MPGPAPPDAVPAVLREFRESDYEAVLATWRECGLTIKPSDSLPELRRVMERNPGLFLVAEAEGVVVGAVIGAWDGRRGWIYHLAVRPPARRRGIARMLMDEVERRLRAAGATKVNLLVERSNVAVADFYRTLGYAPDDLLFMGKRLE